MTLLGPFIVGLSGKELSDADIARVQSPHVGGLILFTRNFENRSQLIELVKSIRENGGQSKPIFVDHEGGRVQRFRDGFTAIPAMAKVGALAERDFSAGLQAARECGFVLAAELRACGIDMSFTPVLDLAWGNSEIIGNRAFSKDPERVAQMAGALMHGLSLAGMQACGKHFPGHGWVKADSHLALPVDSRPLEEIRGFDLAPYRSNTSLNMASIMPAHVVYEQIDPNPACFSKFWLQDVLRTEMKYDGCIISDDLDMVGAHGVGNILARASAALSAGCDAVLACNNFEDIDTLIQQPIPELAHHQAERSRRLSRLLGTGQAWTWNDLQASADYQRAVERIGAL